MNHQIAYGPFSLAYELNKISLITVIYPKKTLRVDLHKTTYLKRIGRIYLRDMISGVMFVRYRRRYKGIKV